MFKIRINITFADAGNPGEVLNEYSDGLEMAAVPRVGDELAYKVNEDSSRLSTETKNRMRSGKNIYRVKRVMWDTQDPGTVDVFIGLD